MRNGAVQCELLHFGRTFRHDHEKLKPVLENTLMSNDDICQLEVITGAARRRHWPVHEKPRIIREALASGEFVSATAWRNNVSPTDE